MRQRGQSAAGTRKYAPARNGNSSGTWRRTRSSNPPIAYRKSCARLDRRHRRNLARLLAGRCFDITVAGYACPLSLDPQPDFRVIIVAVLLALLSGVIFGLAPALQTTRWDLTQGLRERAIAAGGGIHRWNLRNLLVIAQIAVSLLLLIGSAPFLKSFHNAQR